MDSLKVRLLPLLHVQLSELQRTSYLLFPLPPVRGQTGSSKRRTTTPSSTQWISTSSLAMMPKVSEFFLSRKRQSPSSASLCPRPYPVRSGGNCGSALESQTSMRQRLQLDNVMRPLMSSQAMGRDKELAKIQAFCLDAFAPVARYINVANSDSGQLSADDYLEMVRTSASLLGNLSAFCSRLRRSSVLQSVNSRIVDMADKDDVFQLDAGRKLFGEGFTKKAKGRDDELKFVSGPASWRPAQSANLSPFFYPGSQATTGNSAKASKPTEGSHVLDPTSTLWRQRRTTHGGDGINHHVRR